MPPRRLALALALALALPARGDGATDAAMRALRHDDSLKVRTQAAIVLGQRGAQEAVPVLRQAVAEDRAAAVRLAAVGALAKLGARAARPTLQAAAQADADPAVRAAAARAVEGLGPVTVSLDEPAGTPSARAAARGALARHLERLGLALDDRGEVRVRPTVTVDVTAGGGKTVVAAKVSLAVVDGDGRLDLLEGSARASVAGAVPEPKLAGLAATAVDAAAREPCEDLATRLRGR
jgi:HEAT repeat protein